MPFIDSLDIANRALQLCGVSEVLTVAEDSMRNREVSAAYDKVRRAELRRNVWRFAVRKAALRPLSTTTLTLKPSLYDASKTYLIGEVVRDSNNMIWISQVSANINNTPGGSNAAWDAYFGPSTADLWVSATSYFAGELVYVLTGATPNGYQVYMSLTNANTDTPGTATTYDATAQYKQDDAVSYTGSQWRSLLAVNTGNTPADGPLAWSSTTIYAGADTVAGSDDYIYSSVAGSNTGNDPTTDGGIHWTNTGTLKAWARTPTLVASSLNWRPLLATLENVVTVYPVGAGPSTQESTRNVFPLPAGYLRRAPQNPKISGFGPLGGPTGNTPDDWEFDSGFIVSAYVQPIVFRFVADVTKVSSMDDMFCEGLACRTAAAVCKRLTQSDAALQNIASEYKTFMGEARLANAIEEGSEEPPEDDWVTVRA